MLKFAMEWGKVDKALPKVEMLPGENHRDRVLTDGRRGRYLEAATAIGEAIQEAYQRALMGIRATMRGKQPIKPEDPFLLRDVATVLLDCGLRPEECFRLSWEHVRDDALHVPFGKTENARRDNPTHAEGRGVDGDAAGTRRQWRMGLSRADPKRAHREIHSEEATSEGVQAREGCADFPLYTFRHTCLTRWAAYMDPYTLGIPGGPQRLLHDTALCSPAGAHGPGRDGTRASGTGWAQFWAQ